MKILICLKKQASCRTNWLPYLYPCVLLALHPFSLCRTEGSVTQLQQRKEATLGMQSFFFIPLVRCLVIINRNQKADETKPSK